VTVALRAAVRPGDEDGILALVDSAFSDDSRDAAEELAIVRGTWDACEAVALVELVADDTGSVVGHVLAAPGRLDGTPSRVAGVAPVCVAPTHQGRGLGTALMTALIAEAEFRPWTLLVLLGDPAFYGRVGFEAAGPHGIDYPPAGPQSPNFLCRRLGRAGAIDRGEFSYCWETA
jgi:putative acetyltransferase